jgi:hypothetical protein
MSAIADSGRVDDFDNDDDDDDCPQIPDCKQQGMMGDTSPRATSKMQQW